MKKFILIAAIAMFTVSVNAQSRLISSNAAALVPTIDTVTSTGVKTMQTNSFTAVKGPKQSVTISTVNTTLTGTTAGIARLWGSLDGTAGSYSRIRNTQLQGLQVDSLVIDANHKVYHWVVDKSPYQYYQVQTTGVGSGETFTVQSKIVAH